MKNLRFPAVVLLLCSSALLTACEDATNVGENLVGAQGGHPVIEEISIGNLGAAELERPSNLAPRVLAGTVDDPALGTYVVHGYLDVSPVTSSGFRAQPVQHVELRLSPSYIYGDTTSDITLALRDITEAWEHDGLPTDTSFSVGPVIREFTFSSSDTLVVVPLPDDWVNDHDDVLRSTDFGDLFHGFRMDPVAGNAVVGFGPNGSSMFAVSAEDSSLSPLGRSYSSVNRSTTVELPPDRILMQAGSGPIVSFSLMEGVPNLPASSVNRAAVRIWADTLTVKQNTPPNFVRPHLTTLDLYGITDDGADLVARATLSDDGQFVFDGQGLSRSVQDVLFERDTYDRFEIRLPNPTTISGTEGEELFYYTSLNPAIFYDEGAGEKAPKGYITITPLD